jgi:hypothetical protein
VDLTTNLDTLLDQLAADAQQADQETLPISVSTITEVRQEARALITWAREAHSTLTRIGDRDELLQRLLEEWDSAS